MRREDSATMDSQMASLLSKAKFTGPTWYYDQDGDCIEFVISPGAFYARRSDNWVTAYYSQKTDELVGSQIKGIRRLLDANPGLRSIEIQDGRVRLSHLYRASGWSCVHNQDAVAEVYQHLIKHAESADAQVELIGC